MSQCSYVCMFVSMCMDYHQDKCVNYKHELLGGYTDQEAPKSEPVDIVLESDTVYLLKTCLRIFIKVKLYFYLMKRKINSLAVVE